MTNVIVFFLPDLRFFFCGNSILDIFITFIHKTLISIAIYFITHMYRSHAMSFISSCLVGDAETETFIFHMKLSY